MSGMGESASVDDTIAGTLAEGVHARGSVADPAPGSVLGRYVVDARIGMGSMGAVYKAHDPKLGRDIALKLLHARGRRGRDDAAARILREARAIAQLSHPNVVVVNDVGQLGERVFIAMEFVQGQTLGKWLSEGRRGWDEIVEMFRGAGEGLAAAHAADLVHRDFKPDNVLVGEDGRPRVLDFGLARPVRDPGRDDTMPGNAPRGRDDALVSTATRVSGTPAYMAPEQFTLRHVGPHADQFSFCVALWEALFRRRPFEGDSYATIGAAVTLGRRRAAPRGTEVPPRIVSALERGLAVDADERWPSMRSLLDQLAVDAPRSRAPAMWLAGGGAVALGVWFAAGRPDDTTCSGAAQQLSGAWDEDTKADLRQAFTGGEAAFAAQTWPKLERELDAYAAAWAHAHHDACAAAHIRQEQSSALMAARMECLATRKLALRSLTRELRAPSTEAMSGALEAAMALPRIAACSDVDYVTAAVPPPAASIEAEVEDIRARIAKGRAASTLGDTEGALTIIRLAEDDARRVGYEPVRLEAALARGRLDDARGHFEPARETLRDVFFAALAIDAHALASEAATELVVIEGDRLGRFEEAEAWVRFAESSLEASGGPRTELWIARAGLALRTGDLDHAEALFNRALEHVESSGNPHQRAALYDSLAVVHSDRGDYPQARALHERAFALREREFGPDHPQLAHSIAKLANVDQLAGRYDAAADAYERAKALLIAAHGPEFEPLGGLHHNLGRLAFMRGNLDRALEELQRSVVLIERHQGAQHPMLATALNALGATLRRLGRVDEALAAVQRAEAILSRALGPGSVERASTLVGLANIYQLQERLDEALSLHEDAERIFAAKLGWAHPMVAVTQTNRALLHIELGQAKAAVTIAQGAVDRLEASVGAQHPDLASNLRMLGHALNADGRPREAVEPLRRALALQVANDVGGSLRGETQMELARALWSVGERDDAITLADAAHAAFSNAGATTMLESANAWRERNGLPPANAEGG